MPEIFLSDISSAPLWLKFLLGAVILGLVIYGVVAARRINQTVEDADKEFLALERRKEERRRGHED